MKSRDTLTIIALPTLIAVVLMAVSVQAVQIEGISMAPTLPNGRTMLVNRAAYGLQLPVLDRYITTWAAPRNGDIIVFTTPDDDSIVVKRLVAAPGEPFVLSGNTLHIGDAEYKLSSFTYNQLRRYERIPEGKVFAAGENEERSRDSRHYGLVPVESIRGRILTSPFGL